MIDRRRLLTTAAVSVGGLASATLTSGSSSAQARTGRPNIVWFRSEDNSASFIGAYGNTLANTPTIDGLAREGVRYARHFSTSPVCAPSKLAILTGMYEASLGPGHNMRVVAKVPRFVNGFATYLQQAGYWCTEQGRPRANPDHNTDLARTGYDDTTGDWRNRPAGKPFFALLGTITTHETHSHATPTAGDTDPADVELPAYHPDDPALRLDRAHYMDQVTKMDGELERVLQKLKDDGLLANTILMYSSDHGGVLPRSKRYCYDSGLHTPLIIWFPPRWQHLSPVPPGSVYQAPTSSIDAPVTILGLAGVDVPSYLDGQAFAGPGVVPRRYAFSGRNRVDEQIDFVRTVRDRRYRYIRNYLPHLVYGQHSQYMWQQAGVRQWETLHLAGELDELQSRFWGTRPADELYDLLSDPDEVVNLAGLPEHRDRVRRMRLALNDHMVAINDNGFIPEGMAAEGYHRSRRLGAFPIKRVMALAGLAGRRRVRHLPHFRQALHDSNEVVRWWGAMGCSQLGEAAEPAAALLRRVAIGDASPWVRAQAADAITRLGRTRVGVPLLTTLVENAALPEPVRLQAVWSLARARSEAASALPALGQVAEQVGSLGNAARYAVRVVSGTYVPAPRAVKTHAGAAAGGFRPGEPPAGRPRRRTTRRCTPGRPDAGRCGPCAGRCATGCG